MSQHPAGSVARFLLDLFIYRRFERREFAHLVNREISTAFLARIALGADETGRSHAQRNMLIVIPIMEIRLKIGARSHLRKQDRIASHEDLFCLT